MKTEVIILVSSLIAAASANAVMIGQTDMFSSGTQGWTSGVINPTPPTTIANGGPAGAGDAYLQVVATGGVGAGSRLVVFNTSQWGGNYTSANIGRIRMDVNNLGATNLTLRLAADGAGGQISTLSGLGLPPGSGWQEVTFDVAAADWSGLNVGATLAGLTELRILHKLTPGYVGDVIAATLGVDNVRALPPFVLGDVNLDGTVNALDISQFIVRITTGTYQAEADTNQDQAVNALDISRFITVVTGGASVAAPEPATAAAVICGTGLCALRRRRQ